ncbi:MAG: dual specificity protein phosphatase family protein [Nitrososphaerales archaeon]|nr:dual specificity protein phosphatase family protein [Nitrososphaerales archaeon]
MGTTGYILRRIRAGVADRPTGFVWVQDALAASGYLASKRQVAWVGGQGIQRILTLTEFPLPSEWVADFEVKHVPMKDHKPPSDASLLEASAYIDESVRAGKRILVHCLAGNGRTMCAVAAYLIRSKGMNADDAITFLRRIRPGAVERRQEVSLREFASHLGESVVRTSKTG